MKKETRRVVNGARAFFDLGWIYEISGKVSCIECGQPKGTCHNDCSASYIRPLIEIIEELS